MRSDLSSVSSGSNNSAEAICDDINDIILSGGCIAGSSGLRIIESYPSNNTSTTTESGWLCSANNPGLGAVDLTARAVCIDIP